MGILSGLEGTSVKNVNAIFITKPNEINKVTTTDAVTAAGTNGAINIWLDDDNHFRCEAMRHFSTVDKQIYSDIEKVRLWAKKWLKWIHIKTDLN